MKLLRNASVLLAETSAFGWFMLNRISFISVLPLIPLGVLYRYFPLSWNRLNGPMSLISSVIISFTVSVGIFNGKGFWAVLFMLIAISLLAIGVSKQELRRISIIWTILFLFIFVSMSIASLSVMRFRLSYPSAGVIWKIAIFYILAFLEPISLGKEYKNAPLFLSVLLTVFGMIAFYALGEGAFRLSEYPYLSVWSGVAFSAFHHTEGIILCLLYGIGIFRVAFFFAEIGKKHCKETKVIV